MKARVEDINVHKASRLKADPSESVWLSPAQAAARIGMSRDYIYAAMKIRGLPYVKLGKRSCRINRDDLDHWMRRQTTTRGELDNAA